MAFKGDGPADVDKSTEHRGSADGTPGLTPLDEEREASVADEGGTSGAVVESQDKSAPRLSTVPAARVAAVHRRRPNLWVVAGAVAGAALGALALRKRR